MVLQTQEEHKPGVEPEDMEGEMLINMVTKAVNAITTRLQSEYCTPPPQLSVETACTVSSIHHSLPTEHCYSSTGLNNGSAQRISITTFLF